MTLIFDAANENASATVGFQSDDCDRDFRAVIERGATALEPPANKGWGVRVAYFKGPGELKFEAEGPGTAPDKNRGIDAGIHERFAIAVAVPSSLC